MVDINYSNLTHINELTKAVVKISGQVNLAAVNAMLLSRKGGSKTLGFAAVTKELRKFTYGLETQMQDLSDSLNRLIYELSNSKKIGHTRELMRRAMNLTGKSNTGRSQEINRELEIRQVILDDGVNAAVIRVIKELDKSVVVCNIGQNLAVLAKIESQTGDHYQPALTNVSDMIETIITSIEDKLQSAKQFTTIST